MTSFIEKKNGSVWASAGLEIHSASFMTVSSATVTVTGMCNPCGSQSVLITKQHQSTHFSIVDVSTFPSIELVGWFVKVSCRDRHERNLFSSISLVPGGPPQRVCTSIWCVVLRIVLLRYEMSRNKRSKCIAPPDSSSYAHTQPVLHYCRNGYRNSGLLI